MAPSRNMVKPAGEWNSSKVVVRGKDVEHWLNGRKILSFNLDSPEVKAGIAKSKFKSVEGFAPGHGHFLLQDHGDEVWFRNIRVTTQRRCVRRSMRWLRGASSSNRR